MPYAYRIYTTVTDDDGEPIESNRWDAPNLHDAVKDLSATRTAHCDGVEYKSANYTAWNATLHITVGNGVEFKTGCREERILCVIDITRGSARRLARLLEAEWSA